MDMIPGGAGAGWCASRVGKGSIMRPREITEIPTGIPPLQGSIPMPVGMRYYLPTPIGAMDQTDDITAGASAATRAAG